MSRGGRTASRWFGALRRRTPASVPPVLSRQAEVDAAAERWRASNAQARAKGCKCGKPATHVRYVGGTIGGIPAEIYSCAEHVNVGSWSKSGDGPWIPGGDYQANALAWMSPPQPTPPAETHP